MSFNIFGKINFISETKVSDFVKFLQDGKIMASKCNKCGKLYFPPRADCPDDYTSNMSWKELSGKGELLTYTTAYFAPTAFRDDVPYTIALAQLEEGLKVYTVLSKDINEKDVFVGMKLQLRILQELRELVKE